MSETARARAAKRRLALTLPHQRRKFVKALLGVSVVKERQEVRDAFLARLGIHPSVYGKMPAAWAKASLVSMTLRQACAVLDCLVSEGVVTAAQASDIGFLANTEHAMLSPAVLRRLAYPDKDAAVADDAARFAPRRRVGALGDEPDV
jgi:hypothetical protein